jgi:AraC-like DNA-binding protein
MGKKATETCEAPIGNRPMEEFGFHRKCIVPHSMGVLSFNVLTHLKLEANMPPLQEHIHMDQMEITYLFNGIHYYYVGGDEYAVHGGEMFVTYPNEVHSTNLHPFEKSEYYYLHVDTLNNAGSFLGIADSEEAATLARLLNRMPSRHFAAPRNCKGMLDEILRVSAQRPDLWRTKLRMLSFQLFSSIIENEHNVSRSISPEIQKSIHFIESNIFEPLELLQVSDYVHLSLSHFKARFKKEMGISPSDYIMRKKVSKACELLLGGSSITNTAYALSFSSAQYFTRVFKQYNSISPKQYIEQAAQALNKKTNRLAGG